MSSHKNHDKLETIKDAIDKSSGLSENEKSQSVQTIEEWILEDKAFGTLEQELMKISDYFGELFRELGLK
jgi:hypothetical protein